MPRLPSASLTSAPAFNSRRTSSMLPASEARINGVKLSSGVCAWATVLVTAISKNRKTTDGFDRISLIQSHAAASQGVLQWIVSDIAVEITPDSHIDSRVFQLRQHVRSTSVCRRCELGSSESEWVNECPICFSLSLTRWGSNLH